MHRSLLVLIASCALALAACASSETVTTDADTGVSSDAGTGGGGGADVGVSDCGGCPTGTECRGGRCVEVDPGGCADGDGDGFGVGCDPGVDCDDSRIDVNPAATERCDEIDNDCDGSIDEDGVCDAECPPTECPIGALRCGPDATPEICEADGLGCGVWSARPACAVGFACDAGECVAVGESCRDGDRDGRGPGCDLGPDCDDTRPTVFDGAPELCDTIDNDCDGSIDEDFTTLGDECESGSGVCAATGVFVCAADASAAVCNAAGGGSGSEICGNDLDDDCDGSVDEGFERLGEACGEGEACEDRSVFACTPDGTGIECRSSGAGGTELCGNSLDDDCDGSVDEGFERAGEACDAGVGACNRTGTLRCAADGSGLTCSATPGAPGTELCGNSADDDCDGTVDEGFTSTVGEACIVGVGACERSGSIVCSADRTDTVCNATPGTAGTETCDGEDNDCDGESDEGGVCDGCDDDGFEEDDDRAGAATRPASGSGVICGEDEDWVALGTASAGDTITLALRFTDADGDLDLELYRDDTRVGRSGSVTDDEDITFEVDAAGTYYARIYQFSFGDVSPSVPYGFTWTIDGGGDPGVCIEDRFEENDRSLDGTPLTAGSPQSATLCAGDDDWFLLGTPGAADRSTVNLVFRHDGGAGDIDMEIYREVTGDVPFLVGAYSGNDNEQLSFNGNGNRAWARVFSGRPGAEADYRIALADRNGCGDSDDVFEDNDAQANAASIPLGALLTMYSCGGDEDWYDLGRISEGTLVDVEVLFTHAEGDIDVNLWRELSGSRVESGLSVTDNEAFEVRAPASDRYFLRVFNYGSDGDGQSYRVRVETR